MTTSYKYGRPLPNRRIRVLDTGRPLQFDADPGLIDEVSARYNIDELVEKLKGKDEKAARNYLANFGREMMRLTIELADGKYLDRAGELIEELAKEIGVGFPHRFERYVELSLLGSRPRDRWRIVEQTRRRLVIQVEKCSLQSLMEEKGLSYKELACQEMCLASFEVAAAKTGDKLKMEVTKLMPRDGLCEFCFSPV